MAITVGASNSVWQRRKVTVTGGQTTDVDKLAFSTFKAAKYIIAIYNTAEDVWASQEILVSRRASDSLADTRYAKVGDLINFSSQFIKSGTDMTFRFTNNETHDLIVSLYRLTMN